MKKVVVIGGGVAGLSAGIYAQSCGFDTTILEGHSIAGGMCTSWKRKGYLFEGGMHWLVGTAPGEMNQLWRFVGALDDSVAIHYNDPFMEYNYGESPIRIYRSVDDTESYLLSLVSADSKDAQVIKVLCDEIRKLKNDEMPDENHLSALITENVPSFSNESVSEFFRTINVGPQALMFFLFTMGELAKGDGGFPEGGSLPFVKRMVERFKSLCGDILFNTKAERVIVESGRATGVAAKGHAYPADAVIVASDTMAIDNLFNTPPKAAWLDEMRRVTQPIMTTFISLGVNADLSGYPKNLVIKPGKPIELAGHAHKYLSINNYGADPHYSPAGKAALTIQLSGDSYDFWANTKKENWYDEEKEALANAVIEQLSEQIPEVKGNVEVCDVATPLTYERYGGNWKGSWMTAMTPEVGSEPYPPVIDGLAGVYFAGQRMMPPGGLPPALLTGMAAVEHLCRDMGVAFIGQE